MDILTFLIGCVIGFVITGIIFYNGIKSKIDQKEPLVIDGNKYLITKVK